MADVSVTAASVVKSATGKSASGTAGASITAGQPLYQDAADSNSLKPAQATSAKYKVVGIAEHGAADGQPITYCYEDDDFTPGFTSAVGVAYFASPTAGGIAPIADAATGDYVSVIMVGKSTSKVKLNCSALGRADAASA